MGVGSGLHSTYSQNTHYVSSFHLENGPFPLLQHYFSSRLFLPPNWTPTAPSLCTQVIGGLRKEIKER